MTLLRENTDIDGTPSRSQQAGLAGRTELPEGGVRTVETRSGLAAIAEPATELVIWERSLPSRFATWIDEMEAAKLPDFRILVRPDQVRPALVPLLDEGGLPDDAMRDLLVEDIGNLADTFADVTASDLVDIRLERIDHDACWKFHRDTVEARLVTTYRGPGTEWVRMSHADQALDRQREYSGPLERLRDHSVALFKGKLAGSSNGIVHRSPPMDGSGRTRLFLCLNKRTVTSPAHLARA